ncbi:MAG: hypothetical protein H6502_01930 [Candidatus Woesearchaeota archaeon]|nr:MAG: hypothetical protein H6502_01930 [Candidatus Woesearchaeota archaeon]
MVDISRHVVVVLVFLTVVFSLVSTFTILVHVSQLDTTSPQPSDSAVQRLDSALGQVQLAISEPSSPISGKVTLNIVN